MKIERLHGPSLPLTAWLAYLTMHVSHVSIVREKDLQLLEARCEVLEARTESLEKARSFWHGEYTQVAEAFSNCIKAMNCASNRGFSSPTQLGDFAKSSRHPTSEA